MQKRSSTYLALCAAVLCLAAFSEPTPRPGSILEAGGRFDQRHLEAFKEVSDGATVTMTSRGGDAGYALDAAEIVERKGLTLRITSLCMSACAESLLPAAKKLILDQEAIIGFHGNSMVYRELSGFDPGPCNAEVSRRHEALLKRKGMNVEFWKEQHKRLSFGKFQYLGDTGGVRPECPSVRMSMRARMWLPTSQQLRELYGLKFDGAICADSPECLQRRLGQVFRKGDVLIVGDTPTRVE